MAGRKRKPTALKVLHGNPGKRPLPKKEPKPKVATGLEPPEEYPDAVKDYWRRRVKQLSDIDVLTVIDAGLMEAECDAWWDYRQARDTVLAEGQVIEHTSSFGHAMKKRHPAWDMMTNSWKRWVDVLKETGSTPSSRSKVSTVGEPNESDPWAVYEGGKA